MTKQQSTPNTKPSQSFYAAPREINGINTVGLYTLIKREVGRFMSVYTQTIIAPVVTMFMFYAVFMLAFGGMHRMVGDTPFAHFLAPGLIMMAMAQNAFANTSSSLIIAKVQGNIVDILMPPLSPAELFWAFMIGGVTRGLVVGLVSVTAMMVVMQVPVNSIPQILAFGTLGAMMMAGLGIMGGIWADKFDHIAAFTNFFVTPLTFLSGTFYSISVLPEFWQKLALFNPFFYMIDGFRSGFITQADGALATGLIALVAANLIIGGISYTMIKTGYKIKS